MRRSGLGFTLLEVMIAVAILATLVIPAFELFSSQRHQVSSAQRELLLHAYGLQRLAEEESRLNITHFVVSSASPTVASSSTGFGQTRELLSVGPVADCTGLWQLTIQLSYQDGSSRATRSMSLSKLIVDRDLTTRLGATIRNRP